MHIPNATRSEGLARLAAFLPRAGAAYARLRNLDLPDHPHVSGLSPFLRHRLLTEAEVIAATRAEHPQGAEAFLAEVWWRTYWKGWLEQRPMFWAAYLRGVEAGLNRMATEDLLQARVHTACLGRTGIDGFDAWARDLVATGYLHNHARMWFASIWIFTLRLPWELGADFFLRHLIDGDPASNTLSWRWVAGLHTQGKTYLATAENIAVNTQGRYRPQGLATEARTLPMVPHPAPRPLPQDTDWRRGGAAVLLITEDDLTPEFLCDQGFAPRAVALLHTTAGRSPLRVAAKVESFAAAGLRDAASRLGDVEAPLFGADLASLADWAAAQGAAQVVTPYAPTGPVQTALNRLEPLLHSRGMTLTRSLRDYDRLAWPKATRGFFQFREAVMA